MRRNIFLVGAFTMAILAFSACSNEELSVGNPGNSDKTEVVEGVPTYARFTIKMDGVKPGTRATDDGTAAEKSVKNVHVYVFSNGVFEASTSPAGTTVNGSTGVFHSEVLKLTSGEKTILLVANTGTDWYPVPTAGTSLTTFQNQLMDMYTTPGRLAHGDEAAVDRIGEGYKHMQGFDDAPTNGILMTNLLSQSSFILKPGISQADAEKNNYGGDDPKEFNHFEIPLYRVTAKLQTTYKDADALIYKAVLGNDLTNKVEVGTLKNPTFTVRNLPKDVYLFKHGNTNAPLQTPLYSSTDTKSSWADFKVFDERNEPTLAVTEATGTPNPMYIPENANAVPVIGNTSYVLVKGTFEPNRDYVITDVDEDGNYVYGFKGNADKISVFTYAPDWGVEIYAVPASVTGDDSRVEHGMNTTLKAYLAKANLKQYIGSTKEAPIYDGILGKNVYYSIAAGIKSGIYNTLVISKNVQNDDKTGYDATAVETVKYLQYINGETYYRINIQDNTYPENNNLYYSVTRNNFYKVNVKSISGVGYPNDSDVTVTPENPISQKTYMQAHITFEPWTVIDQDADLN